MQTPYNPNPRDCGGPENSLNLWGEGDNPNAVLADYGNAYSLMLYLYDRYGADFMSRLHRDGDLQGLASLDAALKAEGVADTVRGDPRLPDDGRCSTRSSATPGTAVVLGVPKSRVTTPSLRSTVNLANPDAYDDPGAAPNGADYVAAAGRRRAACSRGASCGRCRSPAPSTLPPLPLAWTIVNDDPDRPGNPVLCSGNANNIDAAAVTSVTVPTADPTLTLPRQVRRGVRLRLRLRAGVDRRRRHLHADRRATRPSTGRSGRP